METKEQVIQALSSHRLAHLRDRLEPLIWPSIRIHYANVQPDHYPIGASRFGGLPDLPSNVAWPQWPGPQSPKQRHYPPAGPLVFLAQINLRDVAPLDKEKRLPAAGLLSFFAATWVNAITQWGTSNEQPLWRVVYSDAEETTLQRVPVPLLSEELRADKDYQFAQGGNAPTAHQFQPCALHFTPEMTLPAVNGDAPLYRSFTLSEEEGERYDALVEQVSPEAQWHYGHSLHPGDPPPIIYEPVHRLLGHWQAGQNEPRHKDARLLLQMDSELRSSDPNIPSNMYWEFGGRGFFFMGPDALAAQDFSNVELVWEVH